MTEDAFRSASPPAPARAAAFRPDVAALPCDAGSRVVWGEGDPDARIVLVGEAPGEEEDRLGRPFVGRSGALLGESLAAAGLARGEVWITNAVKCRPTKEVGGRLRNRAPTMGELAAWAPVLKAELAALCPRCVVGLGAVAGKALFGPAFRLTRERGSLGTASLVEVPALVTWHPAFVLRQRGHEREARLQEVVADLMTARRAAGL